MKQTWIIKSAFNIPGMGGMDGPDFISLLNRVSDGAGDAVQGHIDELSKYELPLMGNKYNLNPDILRDPSSALRDFAEMPEGAAALGGGTGLLTGGVLGKLLGKRSGKNEGLMRGRQEGASIMKQHMTPSLGKRVLPYGLGALAAMLFNKLKNRGAQ